MSLTQHCRVCATSVRSASDGVVFRAGRMTLVLCTKHARLAQTSVVIMGQAAVRGIGRVLEEQYPVAARTLRAAGDLGAAVGAAVEPDMVLEPRRRVVAQVRRPRAKHEDVIEGEFVEVKP